MCKSLLQVGPVEVDGEVMPMVSPVQMVEDSIVKVVLTIEVVRHSDEEEDSCCCQGCEYHAILDSVEGSTASVSASYSAIIIVIRNSHILIDISTAIVSTTSIMSSTNLTDDVIIGSFVGRVTAMCNSTDTSLLRVGINADTIIIIIIIYIC